MSFNGFMDINLPVTRSRTSQISKNVEELRDNVTRFNNLANCFNRSSGAFNDAYVQALREEAQALGSICNLYIAILNYLRSSATAIEQRDNFLARNFESITPHVKR